MYFCSRILPWPGAEHDNDQLMMLTWSCSVGLLKLGWSGQEKVTTV